MEIKQYYENKSPSYGISHTRRKKILELLKDVKGKRILDIGCSTGYLGKVLKEQENFVVGVDISEQASKQAQTVLDRAYCFDVEKQWPLELENEKFDIIVALEIIEHLFDPALFLKKIREFLEKDGTLIITVPNFLSWVNRIKFVFGKFRYTDQGIFDFGHIRFFTRKTLRILLNDSGFEIVKWNNIVFPGKLSLVLRLWPSLFSTQFIVKAKINE